MDKFTEAAKTAIDESELYVSQMVRLELQYIYEIGRLKARADTILNYLSKTIGLKISEIEFNQIIDEAMKISWTRDGFDRLLVAEAQTLKLGFVSADRDIKSNYKRTIW